MTSGLQPPSLAITSGGQVITNAFAVANWYDGLQYLLNPPACICYANTTQTIATGNTGAAVAMGANTLDTYGGHSTTSSNTKYFFQAPGLYLILGTVYFGVNATGSRKAWVAYGGTAVAGSVCQVPASTSAGDGTAVQTSTLLSATGAGDYVEIWGGQNSGSGLTTVAGAPNNSEMTVLWVHQ